MRLDQESEASSKDIGVIMESWHRILTMILPLLQIPPLLES